VEEDNNW